MASPQKGRPLLIPPITTGGEGEKVNLQTLYQTGLCFPVIIALCFSFTLPVFCSVYTRRNTQVTTYKNGELRRR